MQLVIMHQAIEYMSWSSYHLVEDASNEKIEKGTLPQVFQLSCRLVLEMLHGRSTGNFEII